MKLSRNGIQLNDKETQIHVSVCVSTCEQWVQAPAIASGGLGELDNSQVWGRSGGTYQVVCV